MSETIDVTPTWSAIGEIYIRFAQSGEYEAIRKMSDDMRKAFALATAATAIYAKLDEAQKEEFNAVFEREMRGRVTGQSA